MWNPLKSNDVGLIEIFHNLDNELKRHIANNVKSVSIPSTDHSGMIRLHSSLLVARFTFP